MKKIIGILSLFLVLATACRDDEMVIPSESEPVEITSKGSYRGMYLLNEGNMGSNKCTLDYLDLGRGLYMHNIYAERNPNAIKELGDVGNDIAAYGSKIYVVVNCSHKVEVLDAHTAKSLGHVDIPNCRYVAFNGDKAYVSSYVGPVEIGSDSPRGAVFEIDTLSLTVTRQVTVGYQPEEIAFAGGYMYVANSGGYRMPLYDKTISVVDPATMHVIREIDVDINLHHLRPDSRGRLWVCSRGDNATHPSRLFLLTPTGGGGRMEIAKIFDIACSNFCIHRDTLYYISSKWSDITMTAYTGYGSIDLNTLELSHASFITDGTEAKITRPYGLTVHPETGEIFVTDAKNYVSSGTLYCFSPSGALQWSVRTGDIPAAMAFVK